MDLKSLIVKNWKLAISMNADRFIQECIDNDIFKVEIFESDSNSERHHFLTTVVGEFEIIESINPKGYFTHQTAAEILKFTNEKSGNYYFNIKHNASSKKKVPNGNALIQENIDNVFLNPQRSSKNK